MSGLRAAAAVALGLALAACRPAETRPAPPVAAPGAAGGASAAADVETLRRELAAKDAEIDRLRERTKLLDDIDPVAAVVHSIRDLPWKLRTAAAMTEAQRTQFALTLGRELQLRPDRVPDVIRAVREETDATALALLADAIRAGALSAARASDKAALADVVRDGEPAERRRAAAWGMLPGAEATPPECRAAAADRLRSEESPEVIGALAEVVGTDPSYPAGDALATAAIRLPPGEDRRRVLTQIARTSLIRDRGEEAVARILGTRPGDLRDDLAAALARAAGAMSAPVRRSEPKEQRAERMRVATERFVAVYRDVADLTIRRDLARAASAGLDVMPNFGPPPEERAAFWKTVAAAEPDAAQRGRLERLAAGFADGSLSPTSPAAEAILYGRD